MKTYIYTLSHPLTGEIKYIGKTINIKSRQYSHNNLKICKSRINRKNSWIISLNLKGLKPVFSVIKECYGDDWVKEEMDLIKYCRDIGMNILNHTDGGEGCLNKKGLSINHKIKISKSCFLSNKKIKDEDILRICDFINKGFSYKQIKDEIFINENLYYNIISGRRYRHITNGIICYRNKNNYNCKCVIEKDDKGNLVKEYKSIKNFIEEKKITYDRYLRMLKNGLVEKLYP